MFYIDEEWLEERCACEDGIEWFCENAKPLQPLDEAFLSMLPLGYLQWLVSTIDDGMVMESNCEMSDMPDRVRVRGGYVPAILAWLRAVEDHERKYGQRE
jgi:hypothetical protein